MTPLEIVRMFGTEFASISDETINNWINLITPDVSSKNFGAKYNEALALMAMHRMKLNGFGNSQNGQIAQNPAITLYKEGESEIQTNMTQKDTIGPDGDFGLTNYGVQFLALRRSRIIPVLIN